MAATSTFQDVSGTAPPAPGENPFVGLITACESDPMQICERYEKQRANRNAQKREEMLSPEFTGMKIDEILAKLEYPDLEPGFRDWRNCLVFWARPTQAVREVIGAIQQKLLTAAPNLWLMPPANLHMTVMEVAHSLTPEEIERLVQTIQPHAQAIADHTLQYRARLVRPRLNYDTQGLALQFLPATGEPDRSLEEDRYSYHHLRRDVWDSCRMAGIDVASRYVVPSAHLTIARFITTKDFETDQGKVDHEKVERLVRVIDEINDGLEKEYWPTEAGIKDGGEWVIGQEKGLEVRRGTLWYGGGEQVCIGRGS